MVSKAPYGLFCQYYLQHQAALQHALSKLPAKNINEALDLLQSAQGKWIFTGIGKSGFIAKKAAATCSSLGMPAIFLHAAEALHGDLGCVQSGDVILVVAKSGESDEVLATVKNLRQKNFPILSILSQPQSSLAKLSNVVVPAMIQQEAEFLNLAPTASTTVALVILDALAATVSQLRNFSKEDFGANHPSGQLGRRLLLRVQDLLHKDIPVISQQGSVLELLEKESKPNLGGIMITDDMQNLIGLVTDGDLRRAILRYGNILTVSISDIMTSNPITIQPHAQATSALRLMEERKSPIHVLPVVDSNRKPLGLLRLHDLLQARIDY